MKHLIPSAALLAASLSVSPLAAQSINASQPASVAAALQALGLEAQSGTAEDGTPLIVSQLDGATFTVVFYSCDDPRGCQDLQLRAIFAVDTLPELEVLNEWNQSTYMGKAFQSGETVVLEHPIAGADGLSRYGFTRTMARWQLALNGFRQTLSAPE